MATEQTPHVDWNTVTWLLGAIGAVSLFLTAAVRFLASLWRGGSTAVRQNDLWQWVIERVRGTGTGIPKLGERPEGGTILFELAEHSEAISSLGHSDKAQSDRLEVLEAQNRVLLLLWGLPVDAEASRYTQIAEAIEQRDAMKDTGQWLALRDNILDQQARVRAPAPMLPALATAPAPMPRRAPPPLPFPSTHHGDGRDDD